MHLRQLHRYVLVAGLCPLLILLSTNSLTAQTCDYTGLTVAARYSLDSVTTDVSGNNHHPVNTPGLSFDISDKIEGSASAMFSTAGMQLDDGTFLNAAFNTKSLSMFIKPTSLVSGQVLYDEGGPNTGGATGISLVITSAGNLVLTVADRGILRSTSFAFPSDGSWHQVGFVYDGAITNSAWLYLDGYPVNSSNGVNTIRERSDTGGLLDIFGGLVGGAAGFSAYTGLIDEVTLFDTALTTQNMLSIANNCAAYNYLTDLTPMSCGSEAYTVQGSAESNWSTVTLHTGAYTTDLDDNGSELNAIGYNRKDDRVWGFDREGTTASQGRISVSVRDNLSGDWSSKTVGTIIGLENSNDIVVGDVDTNGQLYLAPNSGNVTALIIDVDPLSATYLTTTSTVAINWPTGNSSDWVFHPNDGQLYAINDLAGANLLKINPLTGAVTDLGPSGAETDDYGGIFGDVNGFLYAIANSDGDIFRIDLRTDPGNDYDENKTLKLATGPASSNTDGARCVDAGLYMDFGDIDAANIVTRLTDLGARHAVIGYSANTTNLMLGTSIDVELDVTPNAAASSDGADEDGVTFSSANGDIVTATVVVTNTTGKDATLCGWLDADGDGLLEITEKQCSTAANPGSSFDWTITQSGISTHYSRFRLCSLAADCQNINGLAALGEVEDYVITYDATSTSIETIRLQSLSLQQALSLLGTEAMTLTELQALLASWDKPAQLKPDQISRTALINQLGSFLDPDDDNKIAVLVWHTADEQGTVGFFAERKQHQQQAWQRINDTLLPGLIDAPNGGQYMLFDSHAVTTRDYQYRLIEQETWGKQKNYGPFNLRMQ